MSSLNIARTPHWRAYPSPETTIGQITKAIARFPDLRIEIGPEFDLCLVIARLGAFPPDTDELATVLYGDDETLITSEDSGVFELPEIDELFDQEARDRNADPA